MRRRLLLRGIGLASLCCCFALTLNHQSSQLVILGLGRVGREVARQATFANEIVGTIRRTVTADDDDDPRCRCILFSETEEVLAVVRDSSHLLVTIPPSAEDDAEQNAFFDRIVAAAPPHAWIGVLSTTGVYGDHEGRWVTEETECRTAASPSARRYLAYEAAWQRRTGSHALYIFRCAGIYGGGQSALHTVYQKGLPATTTTTTPEVTNRIHVSDLAAAVVASMQAQHDARTAARTTHLYNLADDLPASRAVVMEYAAELLRQIGVAVSERATAEEEVSTVRGQRRRAEVKRVANDKMKRELLHGAPLRFPTYQEGLRAILQDPTSPWWQHEHNSR